MWDSDASDKDCIPCRSQKAQIHTHTVVFKLCKIKASTHAHVHGKECLTNPMAACRDRTAFPTNGRMVSRATQGAHLIWLRKCSGHLQGNGRQPPPPPPPPTYHVLPPTYHVPRTTYHVPPTNTTFEATAKRMNIIPFGSPTLHQTILQVNKMFVFKNLHNPRTLSLSYCSSYP